MEKAGDRETTLNLSTDHKLISFTGEKKLQPKRGWGAGQGPAQKELGASLC